MKKIFVKRVLPMFLAFCMMFTCMNLDVLKVHADTPSVEGLKAYLEEAVVEGNEALKTVNVPLTIVVDNANGKVNAYINNASTRMSVLIDAMEPLTGMFAYPGITSLLFEGVEITDREVGDVIAEIPTVLCKKYGGTATGLLKKKISDLVGKEPIIISATVGTTGTVTYKMYFLNGPAPKCPTCGSTQHTTHPVVEVPKCPTCGSTQHKTHPVEVPKCPTCGSTQHKTHPVEVPKCPTCGSTQHTTHPVEVPKCPTCGSTEHKVHLVVPVVPEYEGTVKSFKVSAKTTTSISLKWSKPTAGAAKYQIEQVAANGKVKKATTTKISYKFSKLSAGSVYTYKITPLNKDGVAGKTIEIKGITTPKKVTLSKVTGSKKAIKATWKKTEASGYQVVLATNKKFTKGVKKVTINNKKTLNTTFKKLASNKTYYVRVRAFTKAKGVATAYGAWSKAKSVKVK